jgi:hypothetical protein
LAVSVTINNKTYSIPSPGEDPGWGEATTDWIVEANKVIANLFGPGDILQTSFNLSNNVIVSQPLLALSFNATLIRSAFIEYSVYRRSDSNPFGNVESGIIQLIYDNDAPINEKWKMTREYSEDSGIDFFVNDLGQLSYTTTDIGAAGHTGVIKFRARALSQ